MNDTITWTRDDGADDFRTRILPLLREGLEVTVQRGECVSIGPLRRFDYWRIADGPIVAYDSGPYTTAPHADIDSITFTRPEPEWASARIIAVGEAEKLYARCADLTWSSYLDDECGITTADLDGPITVVVDAEGRWTL